MSDDLRYQMAYSDWHIHGGCFRKLKENPQHLTLCAHTMGEFERKDLIRGLPDNAPWGIINDIKALAPRVTNAQSRGEKLDPQLEASFRQLCLQFNDWACQYFSSTTPPSQRSSVSQERSGGGGCGFCGCATVLVVVAAVAYFIWNYFSFQSQDHQTPSTVTNQTYNTTSGSSPADNANPSAAGNTNNSPGSIGDASPSQDKQGGTSQTQAEGNADVLPGEKYPETRQRYMTADELSTWTWPQVRYATNEIFARHGYPFENPEVRAWFTGLPWYRPVDGTSQETIIKDELAPIEAANLKLLVARGHQLKGL